MARMKRAHFEINYAIRTGKITRPNICEKCGCTCVPRGHHPDYRKPLYVQWLCRSCHSRLHNTPAVLVKRRERVLHQSVQDVPIDKRAAVLEYLADTRPQKILGRWLEQFEVKK